VPSPVSSASPPVVPTASTPTLLFDENLSPDGFLPRGDPADLGLDRSRLDELVRESEETLSDSLLIIKDGRVVVERYFGNPRSPIETMSVTKSIVSLAIGMLVADGKIASIDAPVSTWYPEWKKGPKARVTLRHLLTHTSGIENKKGIAALNASKDRLKFSRALKIGDSPGAAYRYSNEGSMLLSGIVKQAAGRSIDAYLSERLFAPLGIRGWSWARDTGHNAQTYYGLALHARDLARIGMLMLADGKWEGREVLPASWVQQATTPGSANPNYGLLWNVRYDGTVRVTSPQRLESLRALGFVNAESLRPMVDRSFSSDEAWWMEAGSLLAPDERSSLASLKSSGTDPYESKPGRKIGYSADGSLGQRLGVWPEAKVVAVRQHKRLGTVEDENQKCGFPSFHDKMARLVVH